MSPKNKSIFFLMINLKNQIFSQSLKLYPRPFPHSPLTVQRADQHSDVCAIAVLKTFFFLSPPAKFIEGSK